MKLSLLYAKLLNNKGGTFRVLKEGEALEEADLQVGVDFVQNVSACHEGQARKEGEIILRLEFNK